MKLKEKLKKGKFVVTTEISPLRALMWEILSARPKTPEIC